MNSDTRETPQLFWQTEAGRELKEALRKEMQFTEHDDIDAELSGDDIKYISGVPVVLSP